MRPSLSAQRMPLLVVAIAWLLAACSAPSTPGGGSQTSEAEPSFDGAAVQAQSESGPFVLTLVASRSVWSEGEPIDLQASLIFEAGEPRIQVAGSGSGLISFSLQELNGRRKVEGAATSDCRFYTMRGGVPVSTRYTKSGAFSDGDPDAAWVRAFLQDPLLRLPKGRWRVTAYSDFFEQTCDSDHAHRQISVSLDFAVT